MARGGLDEVPLFRKYTNVARCDITEDVGGVGKHTQGLCHTHYGFRMSRSLGTSTSASERQRRSRIRDGMGFAECLACLLRGY